MHTLTIRNLDATPPHKDAEIYLDGVRLSIKGLQIAASLTEETEVVLVLSGVRVNHDSAGPDARPLADDTPAPGSVFQSLCHGCGKLFRNGDGHACS